MPRVYTPVTDPQEVRAVKAGEVHGFAENDTVEIVDGRVQAKRGRVSAWTLQLEAWRKARQQTLGSGG